MRDRGKGPERTLVHLLQNMAVMAGAKLILLVLLNLASLNKAQFPDSFGDILDQPFDQMETNDLTSRRMDLREVPIQDTTSFAVEPSVEKSLGQIAGIAVASEGELLLFGRGDRLWGSETFNRNDVFTGKNQGPIQNDTIVVVDSKSGKMMRSFGGNRFFMPHGISVDPFGNVWVTDVALHQVLRFPRTDFSNPDIILGEAFIPGNDQFHFCKPTDVAVSSKGVVFISDGYCNSRVVIVSPEGNVLGSIANEEFKVAHSLTLLEAEDLICVADREGRRVACYTAGLIGSPAGKLVIDLRSSSLTRVFAIDHLGEILLAVNGPESDEDIPEAVAIDLPSERLIGRFAPREAMVEPHDLAVAADGNSFFVTDIGSRVGRKVHQFSLMA